MKVMFTPKEYARLLELIYLGQQTLTTHSEDGESPHAGRYRELIHKMLDLATPLGCADRVTVGSDGGLVFSEQVTRDERLGKILGEHANDVFWHELVNRLSDRDLAAEQAKRSLANLGGPPIDADARLHELEEAYWAEFEKNDLSNIVLLRGGKG